jgi:hypothetical protein
MGATVQVVEEQVSNNNMNWFDPNDDDDFMPDFGSEKNPDHKPIAITW